MSFAASHAICSVFKRNPIRIRNRITIISSRCNTDSDTGAPYRPWPNEKYYWPRAAQHWLPEYPARSAKQDEYKKEEIYLHEIEERMRKFDQKFSQSDRIKSLQNEFGWDVWDDRAQYTYGLQDDQSLIHGPGKKIDPDHYVNAEPAIINRKVIPPIQYMTAEQIRRSRGSYSNLREFPPEHPSIWKYWNGISCMGVFGGLLVCKEWFVVGGHDFWDALLLWSIMGTFAAFFADFLAWWNSLATQEGYDKDYFQLLENVKRMNEQLHQLNTKPSDKKMLLNLVGYREMLSEKVLQKTIANRVGRISELTQKQLEEKVIEEAATKKEAEIQWNREALAATFVYYDDEKIKQDFTREALDRFIIPSFAKLTNESSTVTLDNSAVKDKFRDNYEKTRLNFIKDQKKKGSLSPVFADKKKAGLSTAKKVSEYEQRVKQWTQGRNVVNAPTPAF